MIDLHIHSSCSDGELTPEQIAEAARVAGAKIISITDHNTLDAYKNDFNCSVFVKLVPGVELTGVCEGKQVHILGYKFNMDIMNVFLESVYKDRTEPLKAQYKTAAKILKKNGFKVNPNPEIRSHDSLVTCLLRNMDPLEQDGAHREILNSKYSYVEIRDLLKDHFPVSLNWPSEMEVIDIIHKSGGKAFLAHPFEKEQDIVTVEKGLYYACMAGIDGIEINHPSASEEQKEYLRAFTKRFKLLECGGSDFHSSKTGKLFSQDIKYEDVSKWI